MTARQQQLAAWLAVVALVAWSAWQRWQLLASSPFPIGVDGYFYAVQLRALLETGHLQYDASPLAFWLMAPLAAATDPIAGAKLGAALFGALIAVPMYRAGARLGGRGAGLVAAVLATTSAGSEYLSIEFVKNGVGLTVATFALWAVLAALDRGAGRRRIAVAVLAVVAAFLAHKTAAGLVLAIAAPAVIAEAIARGRLRGRRLIYLAISLGAGAIAVAVLGLAAPRLFLSAHDADAIAGALSGTARWTMPALVRRGGFELTMGHEALIGAVCAIGAAIGLSLRRGLALPAGARVAAWACVGLALALAVPWLAVDDPQGLGMRLRICAFVPMALCAALAARAILGSVKQRDAILAGAAVVLALAIPKVPRTDDSAIIRTHPALASAVMALAGQVPDGDTVVVPERHIAFMVAWYARYPVSIQPEPIPRARRHRLLPLAFTGAGSPLDIALDDARREPLLDPPLGLHARHPNGLVLVSESTWEWLLARLPARARSYFGAWPTI